MWPVALPTVFFAYLFVCYHLRDIMPQNNSSLSHITKFKNLEKKIYESTKTRHKNNSNCLIYSTDFRPPIASHFNRSLSQLLRASHGLLSFPSTSLPASLNISYWVIPGPALLFPALSFQLEMLWPLSQAVYWWVCQCVIKHLYHWDPG